MPQRPEGQVNAMAGALTAAVSVGGGLIGGAGGGAKKRAWVARGLRRCGLCRERVATHRTGRTPLSLLCASKWAVHCPAVPKSGGYPVDPKPRESLVAGDLTLLLDQVQASSYSLIVIRLPARRTSGSKDLKSLFTRRISARPDIFANAPATQRYSNESFDETNAKDTHPPSPASHR